MLQSFLRQSNQTEKVLLKKRIWRQALLRQLFWTGNAMQDNVLAFWGNNTRRKSWNKISWRKVPQRQLKYYRNVVPKVKSEVVSQWRANVLFGYTSRCTAKYKRGKPHLVQVETNALSCAVMHIPERWSSPARVQNSAYWIGKNNKKLRDPRSFLFCDFLVRIILR